MALEVCLECGKQISTHAISCPNCGFPQNEYKELIEYKHFPKDKERIEVALGLVIFKFGESSAKEILKKSPFEYSSDFVDRIEKYFYAIIHKVDNVIQKLDENNASAKKFSQNLFLEYSKQAFENKEYTFSYIYALTAYYLNEDSKEAVLYAIKNLINMDPFYKPIILFLSDKKKYPINELQKEFQLGFNKAQELMAKLVEANFLRQSITGEYSLIVTKEDLESFF